MIYMTWRRPRTVRVNGEWLAFEWSDDWVSPPTRLLADFAHLADAPADRVASFAEKWGALGVCHYGHLGGHTDRDHDCQPLAETDGGERLELWWRYAREARAISRVAACLRHGERARPEDWADIDEAREDVDQEAVQQGAMFGPPDAWRKAWTDARVLKDVARGRRVLADAVNGWLAGGGVRPVLAWNKGEPIFRLASDGLFGELARQLAMSVGETSRLEACSACGTPYAPEKRATPGRRHYCPECREAGVPQRDAARDYRQRKAAVGGK